MVPYLGSCVVLLSCLLMFCVVPSGATRCVTGAENNCTEHNSCSFNETLYCCSERYDVTLTTNYGEFEKCECSEHDDKSKRYTCVTKGHASPLASSAWLTCGLALVTSWFTIYGREGNP